MTDTTTATAPATTTDTGAANATTEPATTPATTDSAPQFSAALPEGWHTQLGDEFAAHAPTLERFKGVDDLARSYIHARQMKPSFPGADAAEQDVATWRQLAGVPESPDGYDVAKPEDFPEDLEWNDDRVGQFKELAHKWHVHPGFLKEAMALDTQFAAGALQTARQTVEQQQAEAKESLIKEWGGKFEENSSLVRHLTGRLAESAGLEPHQAQQLANDPGFAKVMLKVNSLLSEDSTRTPAGISDVRSPQQRADDIMAGKDPEWGEPYQRGDRQAMELVAKLLQEAQA